MRDYLTRIGKYLVFDKAITFGVLTRIWVLLSGLVSVFVISRYFSQEQQGYFFTFGNLLALQIFIELGLTQVITQFASHEFADLTWGEKGRIHGDEVHLQRLHDLLSKSAKWFGLASMLMPIILIPIGILFFGFAQQASPAFSWQLPWIMAVIGSSANLCVVPFFSIIMGSGDVAAINYREMLGNILGFCFAWVIMLLHGGLYAFCALTWSSALISWAYLIRAKPELLTHTLREIFNGRAQYPSADSISWQQEIWPMQWKIAVSWMFGYFISNLFNPVLFHYQGAVVAGQMGLTLTAANGLFALSITWLIVKIPDFGKLIAKREWQRLDKLFSQALLASLAIIAIGSLLGWLILAYLQPNYTIGNRFIPANQAALLFGSFIIQVAIHGFAVYLRAHKQEPFLIVTIVGSLVMTCSTIYLGKKYSSMGVTAGYFILQAFIGLPTAYWIWKRCRREWHETVNERRVCP